MQWSFSKKCSSLPQLLSFQQQKPKTGFDSLASSGSVSLTSDAYGCAPKSIVEDGVGYTYPPTHNYITNNPVKAVVGTRKMSNAPPQLTIFYKGSVCVYDNVSSHKAQAIMLLAGNGPHSTISNSANPPPIIAQPLKSVHPATFLSSAPPTVPQFRKRSLARFLEKRKDRAISASPYSDCQSPGRMSLSKNSSGSCPVPATN